MQTMAPEQPSEPQPHTPSPVSTQRREQSLAPVQQPYAACPQSLAAQPAPVPLYTQSPAAQDQQNAQQAITYMTVPQPLRHPPESSRRKATKDILHVTAMVMSIIGMGFAFSLLAKAVDRTLRTTRHGYSDNFNDYLPAMSASPIFAASCLWSLVEMVVRCARSWKAGIHPGAHVGVCLCLWLAAVIAGALLAVLAAQPYDDLGCDGDGDGANANASPCARRSDPDPVFVGTTVLALLLAAVELALFVMACADTHLRNRWRRTLVVASTPCWAPPPPGWHVAAGHERQQQFAAEMSGDEKHPAREFNAPATAA
ncbi:uncharacterized protein MAM_08391 [Metarhizium album ARSEF 1941]|uniref:Uncharacterized protein n=1 Tax=Metarhizium album (strain ARSEF 1941) TaxID=1081103 RepID=A0A0B2WL78_METAS|nr:uncharacterized protein MAM_08391 [Metarhizium album ARSEF 1941]KHN93750.1 hypothetical protein MAM_08391 [Metarhizium album ARSEF 1941]